MKETEEEIKELSTEIIKTNDVNVQLGVIDFHEYPAIKSQAYEVADYIDSIELTESNVKEVKQVLADARKVSSALNSRRIEVKKYLEMPYKEFETQVKEIDNIITQADERLRTKLRSLEEKERQEKKELLFQLWEKRVVHYEFNKYLEDAFDRFLEPRFLGKSISVNKVEDEMINFMESAEKDINTILSMDNKTDVMEKYIECYDLATAIQSAKKSEEWKNNFTKATEDTKEEKLTIIIKGRKDIKLVEMLLKENNIDYEKI